MPDGRVPHLKAVCHIVDSAHDIVQKKPNLSTRLHVSKAFLIKKVAMAISIKNFGLQNVKKMSRSPLKSGWRGGAPPSFAFGGGHVLALRRGQLPPPIFLGSGGRGQGACAEIRPDTGSPVTMLEIAAICDWSQNA